MKKKNKGAALIMVLVAIAIMIYSASVITVKANRVFFTTKNAVLYDKARWYVEGIEGIIIKYMKEDFKKTKNKVYLGMNWAQENQVIPLDEAMISGNVVDEMACFNLNSLTKDVSLNGQTTEETLATDPRFKDEKTYSLLVFIELLKILGADDNTAQTIAHSAYDWIDGDLTTSSSNGAEDQYYMGNHMPHLANNGFFYDKSELRYIRGMNDVLYRRLEPMICALPNDDLNISMNTLKRKHAPLIQALFLSQITLEDAVKVIEERPQYGWDTSAGFFRTEGLRDSPNQMNGLLNRIAQVVKFDSKYFVANIKVSFDDEAYAFTTRFERQTDTRIVVYQRLIGELHE